MRSLHSPLFLSSLAVPLTVAALALTGCSSDDDFSSEPPADTSTAASFAPLVGNVTADGACDPEVIDIDHERPTMSLIYNVPDGYPEAELTSIVHFTDPTRDAEDGGGLGYGGGGNGSRASLITDVPNEDIDYVEVTVTAHDAPDTSETCTIDVA